MHHSNDADGSDADNGGHYTCVRARGMWEISVSPLLFYCKKLNLKIKTEPKVKKSLHVVEIVCDTHSKSTQGS